MESFWSGSGKSYENYVLFKINIRIRIVLRNCCYRLFLSLIPELGKTMQFPWLSWLNLLQNITLRFLLIWKLMLDRSSSTGSLPRLPQWPEWAWLQPRSFQVSYMGRRGTSTWVIFCFSHTIRRELDQKQSFWDMNQNS